MTRASSKVGADPMMDPAKKVRKQLDVHDLPPGLRVDKYVISHRVGAGGMGVVYCAYDVDLDRRVALKFFSLRNQVVDADEEDSDATQDSRQQLLMAEAQAVARLAHPNVVAVYDVTIWRSIVYIAMEFVDGESLRQAAKAYQPDFWTLLEWMMQAGRGLLAVHQAEMVHGDFKPDNLVIGKDGRVCLLDFGLARRSAFGMDQSISHPGNLGYASGISDGSASLAGTPAYAAPEQHEGYASSNASDVYSFCVALFEMFCGQRPFRGPDLDKLAADKRSEIWLNDPKFRKLPRLLRTTIRDGLRPNPSHRIDEMTEVMRRLERIRDARTKPQNVALALALVAGVAAVPVLMPAKVERCRDAADIAKETWNEGRAESIRRAFESTKLPFASESAHLVSRELKNWVWAAAETKEDICNQFENQAAKTTSEQTDLQATGHCVDALTRKAQLVIEEFEQATPGVIENATGVVRRLARPQDCADARKRSEFLSLPEDPELARQVESLSREIEACEKLTYASEHDKAAKCLEDLHGRINEVRWPWLWMRWEAGRSQSFQSLWRFRSELRSTRRVGLLGTSQSDDFIAAISAQSRFFTDATLEPNLEGLSERLREIDAALTRLGRSAELRFIFNSGIAGAFINIGDYKAATPYIDQMLEQTESQRSLSGLDANVTINIALLDINRHEYTRARKYLLQSISALAQANGHGHPSLAHSYITLALLDAQIGHPNRTLYDALQAESLLEYLPPSGVTRRLPARHMRLMAWQHQLRNRDSASLAYELTAEMEAAFGATHYRSVAMNLSYLLALSDIGRYREAIDHIANLLESFKGAPDGAQSSYLFERIRYTLAMMAGESAERQESVTASKRSRVAQVLDTATDVNEAYGRLIAYYHHRGGTADSARADAHTLATDLVLEGDQSGLFRRARILVDSGFYEEAKLVIDKAFESVESDDMSTQDLRRPIMNGLLGRIFAAAGETARARERLRACLSELPQEQVDPTLYATFAFDYYRQLTQDESASKEAQVWLQAGKRASAQAEYRRPLQEYPEAEAYDAATVQALSFLQQ